MLARITFCLFVLLPYTAMANILESVTHHHADNDGVKIHYVALGNTEKPLVVFIHGFPDFWYSWRSQMSALADSYRVVAVDLRGYNGSDKPEGVENYAMPLLVADIAAVIGTEERESAIIVGHDWGGAISWSLAMTRPELVSHLIILNLPHPKGLSRELKNSHAQQQASQYAFNFQQPNSHEFLTAENLTFWVKDPEARKEYVKAFENSSFESMLNFYRANYPKPGESFFNEYPKVKSPVLMFHGLDDTALLPEALNDTWNWVEKDLTLITIPGADHFVQQARPNYINNTIRDWLKRQLSNTL